MREPVMAVRMGEDGMVGPALLRGFGSTALSLPSARLRNSLRHRLRQTELKQSSPSADADRICLASAVVLASAIRDAGPTIPSGMHTRL